VTISSPDAIRGVGVQEVVRQMPDAVVIAAAPSGKLLLANERARELAAIRRGRRAEPDLGHEELELFYPDGRRYERDDWPIPRSARHGEEIVDEEYFQLAADGTRMWLRVSCSPVRDAGGQFVAAVAVARDITEQKRVEEQRAYHAGLVENMEDAVIATDERFLVTAWNRGAEKLYGRTADEVLGRHVKDVVQTDLSDAEQVARFRQITEERRSRIEVVAYRKDGTPVDVELVNVAISGERDEITGYLGIHRDVTERKRAEEELREAQRRSETILESITDAVFALDPSGALRT
jgi:PAS domain S-box-containing protein